jgi:hypothetical protein
MRWLGSRTWAPVGRVAGTVALLTMFLGCQSIPFEPAPVVPTKNRLPQSVRIVVTDVGAYTVAPGATMLTDPNLQNRVTGQVASLMGKKARWEKAIAEYVSARRTFRSAATDGNTDLDMLVRLVLYIDPSVGFEFDTIYLARADAQLVDPGTGWPIGDYMGLGKASGVVRRTSRRDDERPVNQAVRAAFNDLFGKLESDKRLYTQAGRVVVP